MKNGGRDWQASVGVSGKHVLASGDGPEEGKRLCEKDGSKESPPNRRLALARRSLQRPKGRDGVFLHFERRRPLDNLAEDAEDGVNLLGDGFFVARLAHVDKAGGTLRSHGRRWILKTEAKVEAAYGRGKSKVVPSVAGPCATRGAQQWLLPTHLDRNKEDRKNALEHGLDHVRVNVK